jgi:hypothetical protein
MGLLKRSISLLNLITPFRDLVGVDLNMDVANQSTRHTIPFTSLSQTPIFLTNSLNMTLTNFVKFLMFYLLLKYLLCLRKLGSWLL